MSRDREIAGIGMTSQRTRDRLVSRLRDQGIRSERVLAAIAQVPRHMFIDEALAHRAYEDTALPIGYNQTISQPFVVARMTELLLEVNPRNVLEVGTGCGYQTAVLASLVPHVYTIERISGLGQQARTRLSRLKASNVRTRIGDGYEGWPAEAPFEAIIVTAAPTAIPEALPSQLAQGGRLVIPVGEGSQSLLSIDANAEGFVEQRHADVRFVPMLKGISR